MKARKMFYRVLFKLKNYASTTVGYFQSASENLPHVQEITISVKLRYVTWVMGQALDKLRT